MYKSGNIIQSLLYCKLAEQLREKMAKSKKEETDSKKTKKKKEGELNILEDETKYELIKNALNFDLEMDKALFDRNEQMSYNYILDMLKKMLEDIEKRIANKKNNNEFFISQMNQKEEENDNDESENNNNNIKLNNNINNNQEIKKMNKSYDEANVEEEIDTNENK